MALLIVSTVFFASYTLATYQDKTDRQKHEDYKKELTRLYKLKKLKN